MAKPYVVGFDAIELIDGLSEDQPVWLYMRATLYNDGDFNQPLWIGDVGSLPPDANRPVPDGYPSGDAGYYANHLVIATEVRNDSDAGTPNFAVAPVVVGPGQVLEVLVFMFPKVWFETKVVSPDELDRLGQSLLYAAVATAAGPIGTLVGALVGFLQDEEVTVPCFNSVISGRHVFTAADLDAIESAGRQRFGPLDSEVTDACGDPIDSFYWLSVNRQVNQFSSTTPEPEKTICILEPRAYEPAQDQLAGVWGDVGDRTNDCILVVVQFPNDNDLANVYILRGQSGNFEQMAQFIGIAIERATPMPSFVRNIFDDGCPSRSVSPKCPDCSRFVNLSMELIVPPQLLMLGMRGGSHIGTRPPFPIKFDSDRVSTFASIGCPRCRHEKIKKTANAGLTKAENKGGEALSARESRIKALQRIEPFGIGERWNGAVTEYGYVRLWPSGVPPKTSSLVTAHGLEKRVTDLVHLPLELVLSWTLHCSKEYRLATYQELHSDHGCMARLRCTRYGPDGSIVSDVMLSQLPEPIH